MKQIQITHITPPGETIYLERMNYRVYLGNGCEKKFRSKKDAEKFLADTNRFLTGHIMLLNDDLVTLFAEWRRAWPYFQGRSETKNRQLDAINARAMRNLVDVIDGLDRAASRHATPAALDHIWSRLGYCHTYLIQAATALATFRKLKLHGYERTLLENLCENLKKRKSEVENWGKSQNAVK